MCNKKLLHTLSLVAVLSVLLISQIGVAEAQTSRSLDWTLPPTYGSESLISGFTPDPYTHSITSGGSVNVSQLNLGSNCVGYAARAPDFSVHYTAGSFTRLRFFFVGGGDTTLIVNDPQTNWRCDDDSGGNLNPMVTFNNPRSGRYDIWVGSYHRGAYITGTLYVTELNHTPTEAPRLLSPENGAVFSHYPRTTTLRWTSVPVAASYTVEVDCYHCCATSRWCTDVGRTWRISPDIRSTSYTFDFVGAQPGRWRVWAVDAYGNRGNVSGWRTFEYTR